MIQREKVLQVYLAELLHAASAVRTDKGMWERNGGLTFPRRLLANIMDRWTMKVNQSLSQWEIYRWKMKGMRKSGICITQPKFAEARKIQKNVQDQV